MPGVRRYPIDGTPYHIQVVNGPELTVNAPLLEAVRAVHETCFPDEVPRHVPFGRGQTLTAHGGRTETAEGFLDRVTWTAELPATVWYLLWRSTSTSTSTSGAGDEKELVGLATTTPYTNSLYGFNLAVIPRLRGRGLGLRLMRQAQAEALEQGMCVVSATVDTSKPRLLRYYEACGAQVVRSVAVGSGASAPPSVRIQYAFTEAMLRKQLRVSDAKVRRHHHARRRALAAAAAAAAAALWTAWARRRRLKADAHQ